MEWDFDFPSQGMKGVSSVGLELKCFCDVEVGKIDPAEHNVDHRATLLPAESFDHLQTLHL
jgi:hypothetical protein